MQVHIPYIDHMGYGFQGLIVANRKESLVVFVDRMQYAIAFSTPRIYTYNYILIIILK